MARSQNNVITHGLSGKVGDLVVFQQRFGKTFVGKIPFRSGESTAAQKEVQEKFRKGAAYAKSCIDNADTKKLYNEKAAQGVSAFNLALADFFTAPSIDDIDVAGYTGRAGSRIDIRATDDFMVKSVDLTITAANGSLVEKGSATFDQSTGKWVYSASVLNGSLTGTTISVQATDLPGNTSSKEKVL